MNANGSLPVMESFYSLQGEGFHSGKAAYFIRLGGCDVGCTWCDVKESWDAGAHPVISIDAIARKASGSAARFAVVTGGEPCLYDLVTLCNELHKNNFTVALETSGAYSITGKFDWVCVSPKKFKSPLKESLEKADELKVIIYNESDFKWAEEQAGYVNKSCKLYLQPEYSRFDRVIGKMIDYVKHNPKWMISLQAHKVMNIP